MIQESLVPKAGAQFPQRFWMIIEFTCMSTSPRRVSLRNYKVESQRLVNGAITFHSLQLHR